MSITAEEPMILPSLTFLLELFGVFASPSHLTVPDTVIVSPCFLFLMTSAKVVTGRAADGVYLKGRDIDVIFNNRVIVHEYHATGYYTQIGYCYGLLCLLQFCLLLSLLQQLLLLLLLLVL